MVGSTAYHVHYGVLMSLFAVGKSLSDRNVRVVHKIERRFPHNSFGTARPIAPTMNALPELWNAQARGGAPIDSNLKPIIVQEPVGVAMAGVLPPSTEAQV